MAVFGFQERLEPVHPFNLIQTPPGQLLHVLIEPDDTSLGVQHQNNGLCGFDQVFGKNVLFPQRFLGPFPFGDIPQDGVDALSAALVVRFQAQRDLHRNAMAGGSQTFALVA